MNNPHLIAILSLFVAAIVSAAPDERPKTVHNSFYAMDTSYGRPGLSREQQLDLVKELGFAGVSENIRPPAEMKNAREEIEVRGLKLFAVYAGAQVTPKGDLVVSSDLPAVMNVLKGSGAIIWLHIGGKGPAFDSLTGNEPVCKNIRELSDAAKANGMRIAVYPHFGEWTAKFGDATTLATIINHESFGVTFNLCHCLATGDEKKIAALIDAAGPRLFTATINGADTGFGGADWSRLIQPLGKGSFDVKIVLDSLQRIHFAGPIGFQGYGIAGDTRSILEPTIKAWKTLLP